MKNELIQGRLFMETGDLTLFEGDAVVNAANSSLLGGGGVDGAIHRRGGGAILEQCRDIRRHQYPHGLPTGKAVLTRGGDLPAGHVIHTVGPIWKDGESGEEAQLAECYRSSLELARENGFTAIAFPAISTGVYGFPGDAAAPIVFQTIKAFLKKNSLPREVTLYFFQQADGELFREVLEKKGFLNGLTEDVPGDRT